MFELARIIDLSAKMIEQHYGTLIDTAHGAILSRLERGSGHERAGSDGRPPETA